MVRDKVFALVGIQLKLVVEAEVSDPFVHHPDIRPRFRANARIISIAQGRDADPLVIRESVTCFAPVDRILSEPLMQCIGDKDIH